MTDSIINQSPNTINLDLDQQQIFQECEIDDEIESDSESEYSPSESSHASDNEFTDSDDEEEEGPDGEGYSGGLEENQADTAKPKTPRPDTPWKTRNTE